MTSTSSPRAPDAESTSTNFTSRAGPSLNQASTMLNRGGIGHAPSPPPARSFTSTPPDEILRALDLYEANFLPHQSRSLSGIALRSFILGNTLCISVLLTMYLAYQGHPIWRAPFFAASLAFFHFLEFYTTSLTNTSAASVYSFLLSSNGSAYAIAHTLSFTETLLSHYFLSRLLPTVPHYVFLFLGLLLMVVGQGIRAQAMLTAGKSFSHTVAHHKKTTHALVTTGVYSYWRHPSYFGYFWWAIGTQLMCGNVVCLLGYALVLYRFFSIRIRGEEELLVGFFGEEYVAYRARTWVGIPFIK